MVRFGQGWSSSVERESAERAGKAPRGRSAALTGFALVIGALGVIPLWWARLPGGLMLVRIVSLSSLGLMIVALAVLVGVQLMGCLLGGSRDRRRVVTRTRVLLGWYVVVGVSLARDVPLLLNVVMSRPALDVQVRAVQSGRSVPVPARIGGFPVIGVSRDYPGAGGIAFDLPDGCQLVYSETASEAPDPFLHHITGRWYWYRWEGA